MPLSVARDPATGLATWALLDPSDVVHLLRADGVTDHFRLGPDAVGVQLMSRGSKLLLALVGSRRTKVLQVDWE